MRYAMPVVAGLYMTHAFLPPHPGPVALGGLMGVSLGWLIVMGLVCGLPGFIVAGVLLGPNALGLVSDVHQVGQPSRPRTDAEKLGKLGIISRVCAHLCV